jgi:hypothetical protein
MTRSRYPYALVMTGGDSTHLNCRNWSLFLFLTLWLAVLARDESDEKAAGSMDETKKALISAKRTRETASRNKLSITDFLQFCKNVRLFARTCSHCHRFTNLAYCAALQCRTAISRPQRGTRYCARHQVTYRRGGHELVKTAVD